MSKKINLSFALKLKQAKDNLSYWLRVSNGHETNVYKAPNESLNSMINYCQEKVNTLENERL